MVDYIEDKTLGSKIKSTSIMLLAIGGLIALCWFSYKEGKNPPDIAQLPLIKANPEPFKIKPKDPGGMKIPNKDKKVYNAISASKMANDIIDQSSAQLLPPPEEPVKISKMANRKGEPRIDKSKIIDSERKVTSRKVIKLSEIPRKPVYRPPGKKKKANSLPGELEGIKVQLGSFRSVRSLQFGWKKLQRKYPKLLAGLRHEIQTKQLTNGVFHRLQAGSFDSENAAQKLCKDLISRGEGCLIAR